MGRWIQLSKLHPEITADNEVVNVHELGGKEGDQVVQGQHFFTADKSGEAQALAIFMRTESALKITEAERLFKENIWTRLRDGYVHVRYFNFRPMKHVYIGKWDAATNQFVSG
jgi:hypothetical protein